MLTIELRFPGGRYHASPWDHHVNEGVVEWPPSPIRLVRALLSTWHLKARDELDEGTMRALCAALASELPVYELPRDVTPAHTRHYMPVRTGNPTKVFDAFLRLDLESALAISWPGLNLEPVETAALELLLSRLSYIGRAESWVDARLAVEPITRPNARPLVEGEDQQEGETVRVLCLLVEGDYPRWRAAEVDRQLSLRLEELRRKDDAKGKPVEKTKLGKKDRERVEAGLASDLFEALHVDTNLLRKQGWSAPPGTRWVSYLRPPLRAPVPRTTQRHTTAPTAVRFAVSGMVLPALTDAVRFAEAVRGKLLGSRLAVFHGKDEAGVRLSGHGHALFLPESLDGHGHITHLNLVATDGFDEDARRALDKLTTEELRLRRDDPYALKLTLIGIGEPHELGDAGAPLFQAARHWRSVTPFVPTRHAKRQRNGTPKLDEHGLWIGSAAHDLRRLMQAAGLPGITELRDTDRVELGGRTLRWLDFRRWREHGGGDRGDARGYGFCVEFASDVQGPLAFGYGAHFGLGMFRPERP